MAAWWTIDDQAGAGRSWPWRGRQTTRLVYVAKGSDKKLHESRTRRIKVGLWTQAINQSKPLAPTAAYGWGRNAVISATSLLASYMSRAHSRLPHHLLVSGLP